MLQAVGIVVGGAVVYGLSGTLGEWLAEEVTLLVPVLLLALLHPRARDLVRCPRTDRTMGALVGVAAVPWLVFAVDQALLQWRNVSGDAHAGLEHWATAALLTVVVLWCGLLGSSDHSGWRLPAWIAALGVHRVRSAFDGVPRRGVGGVDLLGGGGDPLGSGVRCRHRGTGPGRDSSGRVPPCQLLTSIRWHDLSQPLSTGGTA